MRKEILQRRQTKSDTEKPAEQNRPIHSYVMKNEDFSPLPGSSPNKTAVVKGNAGAWKSNETHKEEPRLLGNAAESDTPPQTKDLEEKLRMLLEKLSSMTKLLTLVITKLCKLIQYI